MNASRFVDMKNKRHFIICSIISSVPRAWENKEDIIALVNAQTSKIYFYRKIFVLSVIIVLTVTIRKPSEHINIVFDANINNAMYVYKLSILSEIWIIFWCFRIILFIMIMIDFCSFSISLGINSANQRCKTSIWPPTCII